MKEHKDFSFKKVTKSLIKLIPVNDKSFSINIIPCKKFSEQIIKNFDRTKIPYSKSQKELSVDKLSVYHKILPVNNSNKKINVCKSNKLTFINTTNDADNNIINRSKTKITSGIPASSAYIIPKLNLSEINKHSESKVNNIKNEKYIKDNKGEIIEVKATVITKRKKANCCFPFFN